MGVGGASTLESLRGCVWAVILFPSAGFDEGSSLRARVSGVRRGFEGFSYFWKRSSISSCEKVGTPRRGKMALYSRWSSRDEISRERGVSSRFDYTTCFIISHIWEKISSTEKVSKLPWERNLEEIDPRVILSWFSSAHTLWPVVFTCVENYSLGGITTVSWELSRVRAPSPQKCCEVCVCVLCERELLGKTLTSYKVTAHSQQWLMIALIGKLLMVILPIIHAYNTSHHMTGVVM